MLPKYEVMECSKVRKLITPLQSNYAVMIHFDERLTEFQRGGRGNKHVNPISGYFKTGINNAGTSLYTHTPSKKSTILILGVNTGQPVSSYS